MPRFAQSVLLDTGPIVALVNRADRHHLRALGWFRDFRGKLVTTEAVVTEVVYVLGRSSPHQGAALLWLARMAKAGLLAIEPMSDLVAIAKIMKRYASLPTDFADASLVWLALTRRVNRVATVDEADFAIYRSFAGKRFINVFGERTGYPSDRDGARVRQMLGRGGEAWGAESGTDRLVRIK